jgi:hypothetical protein
MARFHVFGVSVTVGGQTTLDEVEQADSQYNELRESGVLPLLVVDNSINRCKHR